MLQQHSLHCSTSLHQTAHCRAAHRLLSGHEVIVLGVPPRHVTDKYVDAAVDIVCGDCWQGGHVEYAIKSQC